LKRRTRPSDPTMRSFAPNIVNVHVVTSTRFRRNARGTNARDIISAPVLGDFITIIAESDFGRDRHLMGCERTNDRRRRWGHGLPMRGNSQLRRDPSPSSRRALPALRSVGCPSEATSLNKPTEAVAATVLTAVSLVPRQVVFVERVDGCRSANFRTAIVFQLSMPTSQAKASSGSLFRRCKKTATYKVFVPIVPAVTL
jgi:hypothetical protein